MGYTSTDTFLRLFIASLVRHGHNKIQLGNPRARDMLFRIYQELNLLVDELLEDPSVDCNFLDSVIEVRNIFTPSTIGAFDRFEAAMRSKQGFWAEHPNPYYLDLRFKINDREADELLSKAHVSAKKILDVACAALPESAG